MSKNEVILMTSRNIIQLIRYIGYLCCLSVCLSICRYVGISYYYYWWSFLDDYLYLMYNINVICNDISAVKWKYEDKVSQINNIKVNHRQAHVCGHYYRIMFYICFWYFLFLYFHEKRRKHNIT